MTQKTIVLGLVALAFVTGTIVTGTMADAAKGEPFEELQAQLNAQKAQVDSFFDIFTEISVHNEDVSRIDTEIVALNLRLDEVTAPTETAASNYYLKIGDIKGESTDREHKEWIIIESFSQGQAQTQSSGTGGPRSSHVVFSDVSVSKELDKASPKIAEAVATGKHFPTAELHLTTTYDDGSQATYYAYELKNVQVVSYSISGQGQSEGVPTEQFSLNFEEIKVTYSELDENGNNKGNVEYSWKVEEGEP